MDIERLQQLTQKYLDGTATPEEKALLDDWYHSFEGKDMIIPGERGQGRRLAKKIKKVLPGRLLPKVKRMYFYYAAASIIVLLAAGILFFQPVKEHTAAAVAQHRILTLPDGSKVWLNAESSIEYAKIFTGKTRQIHLSGEGYFDIMHDSLHPFIINAGNVKITVLGTAFNVNAYPGKPVAVTVTRGKVKVEDNTQHIVFITPNQQAVSVSGQLATKAVKAILYDSWKDGSLDFTDESFEDIALTLQRQFNVTIHFREGSLKQLRFTAGFDKGTALEKMLAILSRVNGTSWVKDEDGTIWITN